MGLEETENKRHELLEALSKELNDELIAAVVRKDEGAPEMVSAILDEMGNEEMDLEVLGDFYFRAPETENDEIQVFMCVITITDELPPERLPAMYEAICYVNFTLPAGCFAIDKDHRFLCYVLNTLLPMDMDDDALFREMDIAVGNACAIADSYIGILTDVLSGKVDVEGLVEFLGGPEEG